MTMLQPGAEIFYEAMMRNRRARELAMKCADWDAERCPARAGVEVKYDGIGFIWMRGEALTLEGVPFDASSRLLPAVQAIERECGGDFMLHGEFCEPGGWSEAMSSFRKGNSTTCMLYLWDAVPMAAWEGEIYSQPLHERRNVLEDAFAAVQPDKVYMSKSAEFTDAGKIEEAAGAAWESGQEGIVVKDLDSPYVRAVSPSWMRIKRTYTLDLAICRVTLAGDNGTRLAQIGVVYQGRDVSVAVGFSAAMRRQPHLFVIGAIVEIKHNGETAGGCLKNASFVRIRGDKGNG